MKKFTVFLLAFLMFFSFSADTFASAYTEIPLVTKAEARKIAEEYIKSNAFEIVGQLDFENEYSVSYNKDYPYGYSVSYRRVVSGIVYDGDTVSLLVDSRNGDVSDFSVNFDYDVSFPDFGELISESEANARFVSSGGMKLRYNKIFSSDSYFAKLIYAPSDDFAVNAVTGNIIVFEENLPKDGYFDVTKMAENSSVYFDDNPEVMSLGDADKVARNVRQFEIDDGFSLVSADFLKGAGGNYFVSLKYESASFKKQVTVDAVAGIPVEYFDFSEYDSGFVSSSNADEIQKLASEYYSGYLGNATLHTDFGDGYTVYLWERKVNGVNCPANGLYISYSDSGHLVSLSFCMDSGIFDSTDGVIDSKYAYNSFFVGCGLELSYYKRPNGEAIPIYRVSSSGTGIIDAKTGRQLSYDGTPFYSAKDLKYADINSHYSNYAALALADCGIYASSGTVKLGDPIKQKEFLLLLSELITDTKPVISSSGVMTDEQCEMLYEYMYQNGVLAEDETSYNGTVTRGDAVRYMLEILGYGAVGEMKGIFANPFADFYDIPEKNLGYIALAKGLGIVKGDIYGRFNADIPITNGESLIMIYNFLKGESK